MSKEKFIVADYYKDFCCKCGDCRSCCCVGWPVTISYTEYCKLIGINCSPALRRKLDCAFYIVDYPTNDAYARIEQNWQGDCPLRDKDGFCALQRECGEEALPEICKMYPRSLNFGVLSEGACANSCERVLELMFGKDDKLTFSEREIETGGAVHRREPEISELCKKTQQAAIEILQDRTKSFIERLDCLGEYMAVFDRGSVSEAEEEKLISLVYALEDFSPNFARFSSVARKNLGIGEEGSDVDAETGRRYREAFSHFQKVMPKYEKYMEDVMINHLFFMRFPYATGAETLWDEYVALRGAYKITVLVSVGYMADKNTLDDFIDCIAGLFRCFEHSNAARVIDKVLKTSISLSK